MARPVGGKIHALPIKVSYTVEGSGSYCTVLNERHNVYVHPAVAYNAARTGQASSSRGKNGTPARNGSAAGGYRGEAVMGSCCLRDVAWGVCYASPECVPAPRYHDFSVYTLDPSRPIAGPSRLSLPSGSSASNTPVAAHRRISHAQSHPASSPVVPTGTSPHPHTPSVNGNDPHLSGSTETFAWHGKGFLSWALYEPEPGTTLIRGKLVRSAEFEGVAVEGGLEGLMAAAAAAEREGSAHSGDGKLAAGAGAAAGSTDDDIGDGDEDGIWGLEVELNLKMVHLGGRSVSDKKEFGEMIARGKDVAASTPHPQSAAGAPTPVSGAAGVAHPANQRSVTGGVQSRAPPPHVPSPALSAHGTSGIPPSSYPQPHTGPAQQQRQQQQQQQQSSQPPNQAQGAQNRQGGPRRIEPRLLSQPGPAGPAQSQGQPSHSAPPVSRMQQTQPQPQSQPIRTSTSATAPSGPQRSSSGSSGYAGNTSSVLPASSRSDSAPMHRSSSNASNAQGGPRRTAQPASSSSNGFAIPSDPNRGGQGDSSQPSSSSGIDERIFGSDATPRAQRANLPGVGTQKQAGKGGAVGGKRQNLKHKQEEGEAETADDQEDQNENDSDREVTPPPVSRPMGPPCTPGAQAALASLLGPDGRMSPTAVRALANSSTFRKLLAQAPVSPLKMGQAAAAAAARQGGKDGSLRSPFGSDNQQHGTQQRGDMGAKDPHNPFLSHPPAFSGPSSASKSGSLAYPLTKPSPAGSDIPTPASTSSFHGAPQSQAHSGNAGTGVKPDPAGQAPPLSQCPIRDGCNNCSTMFSKQWFNKKTKDGVFQTVCHDCGLYFNAHKRMRPRELWGAESAGALAQGIGKKTTGAQSGGAAAGAAKQQGAHGVDQGANKRAKVEGVTGVRSSPRKSVTGASGSATNSAPTSDSHAHSADMSNALSNGSGPTDSPRRKKRAPPPPSPRRATRAAVKEHPEAFPDVDLDSIFGSSNVPSSSGNTPAVGQGGLTNGNGQNGQNNSMSGTAGDNGNNVNMDFDINAFFGTGADGTIQMNGIVNGAGAGEGDGGEMSNIDFDALLAQFVNEGGDVGQIWDLGMGMGMGMGMNMGMEGLQGMQGMQGMDGMNLDMGMSLDMGMAGMEGMQGMQDMMGPGEADGDVASGNGGTGANGQQQS